MPILIPTRSAADWQRLLAEPERHWKVGYSARALAYCWEETDQFPATVRAAFERSPLKNLTMLLGIPEHRVPLPGGGKASQTDIFVLARSQVGELVAIAVEGKVNEPFGERVGEWLKKRQSDGSPGPSKGRSARLEYLLGLLQLGDKEVSLLRYQLLHRTAAALIEAKRFGARQAVMLVHSFSPTDSWFEDYAAFGSSLGVAVSPDEVVSVGERDKVTLHLAWVRGESRFLTS